MTAANVDRYITFCGLYCDEKADELIDRLEQSLQDTEKSGEQWLGYFTKKRQEQAKMKQDNLHFVGSQINTLAAYFEHVEDDHSLDLLWTIEEQCC